jgi:hypothetical protein
MIFHSRRVKLVESRYGKKKEEEEEEEEEDPTLYPYYVRSTE